MAFDLSVESPVAFPRDLRAKWEVAIRDMGVIVEVYPSFVPATWGGGFLPMKVMTMRRELIATDLQPPALSGFEIYFEERSAEFRSAMGRTSTEFALMCLCAGMLAAMVGGSYVDPQADVRASSERAVEAAAQTIRGYLEDVPDSELRQYAWKEWN